jgi:hypothetical protein
MGYSNNTQFPPLTNEVNLYSDGCGETYEQKYYVNGAYIDLCGLSVKEYMNNPCCGGTCTGGGSKPKNNIRVISYEEEGLVYYQAVADYPVTSNVKIRIVNSETDVVTELDIYIGETQSVPEIGDSLTITDVTLDVEEDDDFEYVPAIGDKPTDPEIITYNAYIATLHVNDAEQLTAEQVKELPVFELISGNSINLNFVIPPTTIETGDMEEDELNQFCEENQYSFVLILPKKVYNDKLYAIYNYGGADVTYKFVFDKTYVIDSIEYVSLIEKGTDDIAPYVPLYNDELAYEYKLTMKK